MGWLASVVGVLEGLSLNLPQTARRESVHIHVPSESDFTLRIHMIRHVPHGSDSLHHCSAPSLTGRLLRHCLIRLALMVDLTTQGFSVVLGVNSKQEIRSQIVSEYLHTRLNRHWGITRSWSDALPANRVYLKS